MMLSELEQALIEVVEGLPGSTAGEIADHLGIDASNARRDLKKLCHDGRLSGRREAVGRQTIRFYPVGSTAPNQEPTYQTSHQVPYSEPVIDVAYRDVTPPSPSRALVPSNGSVQPYDSRLESALRQHAAAKARQRSQGGLAVPGQLAGLLNLAYLNDPDGSEALGSLQEAVSTRLREASAHEAWQREQYAKQQEEERARKEAEEERERKAEMHQVMMAWLTRG